jgi:hypothetical protein
MSRFRSGEALVFTIATALTLIHAFDDAFVHRGPGLGLGQHALAGAISIAAAVAGVLAFPRLRPGLRAAVAFAFGGLAIVNGMLHVIHTPSTARVRYQWPFRTRTLQARHRFAREPRRHIRLGGRRGALGPSRSMPGRLARVSTTARGSRWESGTVAPL